VFLAINTYFIVRFDPIDDLLHDLLHSRGEDVYNDITEAVSDNLEF